MIAGIFHKGSGLGNQLHRYVMTRVLALDKGLEFGMCFPENFKGSSFMNPDMGVPVKGLLNEYLEPQTMQGNDDIRDYDWKGVLNIKDFTLVDGEFQGEKYFEHHLDEIREWLRVWYLHVEDDVCVINFRGGEYVGVKDLFLPLSYWDNAIALMRGKYPGITFEVHTDDPVTAKDFFPEFPIHTGIQHNWTSIRYAKHLIISNSSFAILPALLGDAEEIIAPLHWAGHNKGFQQQLQNVYKRFTYIM